MNEARCLIQGWWWGGILCSAVSQPKDSSICPFPCCENISTKQLRRRKSSCWLTALEVWVYHGLRGSEQLTSGGQETDGECLHLEASAIWSLLLWNGSTCIQCRHFPSSLYEGPHRNTKSALLLSRYLHVQPAGHPRWAISTSQLLCDLNTTQW